MRDQHLVVGELGLLCRRRSLGGNPFGALGDHASSWPRSEGKSRQTKISIALGPSSTIFSPPIIPTRSNCSLRCRKCEWAGLTTPSPSVCQEHAGPGDVNENSYRRRAKW